MAPWRKLIEATPTAFLFVQFLGIALTPIFIFAAFILLFGMVAFCIYEDEASPLAKVLWLGFSLFSGPFAAAIYFFCVYRKQAREAFWRPAASHAAEA